MKNKLPKVFVGLSMIVITLVFSSSSCNRGLANFTLSGVISDATFSTGLSGAELKLSKVSITTGEETLMETKILGADGKFEFTFSREKIEKYILKVTKPLYFDIEEDLRKARMAERGGNADTVDRRIEADRIDFADYVDYDVKISKPYYTIKDVYDAASTKLSLPSINFFTETENFLPKW